MEQFGECLRLIVVLCYLEKGMKEAYYMSVLLRLVPRGADITLTQMFFVCSGYTQVPPSCTELSIECKL